MTLNENGSPLDQYKIEFKAKDDSYVQILDGCDGTDANVKANNYCIFPMTVFMQSPLNLVQGDLIVARVSVRNSIGWTASSSPDNVAGPLVQTRPSKP